ncbi:MAG: hypothetical protein JWM18_4202 [Chloroflexi bacterium]|jgi:hypothetical protein|nr:hypothetical protein [Chloroflexota bacterium]MEA2614537.1 hypothetical protein [Chloroflexota bacterium]
MTPEHDGHHGKDGHREAEPDQEPVWVQGVNCGRCGWPNARQVQRGMRRVQFVCQWCEQFTTAVVDPTLRGMIGF